MFWDEEYRPHLAQVELSFLMIELFYVYMLWAIGNTRSGGGEKVGGIRGKERNG
jgi:hypothetical protein